MTALREELEALEARAEMVRRRIAAADCAEVGHTWVQKGGRWCGCHPDACCSLAVMVCTKCGDCDYGDSPDAQAQVENCDIRKVLLA